MRVPSQKIFILISREGAGNLWHTLIKIFSMAMTLDTLCLSTDPSSVRPILGEEDLQNSQVIVLDDLPEGPFYDVWGLLTSLPILRKSNLTLTDLKESTISLPLAGGTNLF